MANSMVEALVRAGLIDPDKAKALDDQQSSVLLAKEEQSKKAGQRDKHGVPVIASNDNTFFSV
jgi:hypothetical protein